MMKTEIVGSAGQQLNLAPQKKATLKFSIANAQLSQATSLIPLWYFDEKSALWKEEGNALKVGTFFQGDVAHFTWWNCDYPVSMINIHGIVKDCFGVPLANTTILFNGIYTLTTNSNGIYSAQWPYSSQLNAQVLASMNSGITINSNIIQEGPFVTGSTNNLPDLIIPCSTSKLVGNLKDCSGNPVSGFVIVTGSQLPVVQYCPNGTIDLNVLPNLPLNLVAYVRNYSGATSIISAPIGSAATIGDLTVCNVDQQSNIIINGDGYNNQKFIIDTTTTNTIYSPSGPTTGLIISGYTSPGHKQCLIQIDFCGNNSGVFPLGPTLNCNSDVSMILDGIYYYPDDINSLNDFISVLEYGNIHEYIRGTYFTHLERIDSTNTGIPITMSGMFIVPRRQ